MTDLRTAAQQAIALICSARLCEVNSMSSRQEMLRLLIEATDTLRAALTEDALQRFTDVNQEIEAALAKPTTEDSSEVEPVAWMYTGIKQDGTEHGPHLVWKPAYMDAMSASKGAQATPLYAGRLNRT